jgi:adenylylsulfate kinase
MGLSGSGKTVFSQCLMERFILHKIDVKWFNADDIRHKFNDWDFSYEGRIRQSHRMREFADSSDSDIAICDFIAPFAEMRDNFDADWVIWLDTVQQSKFNDTDEIFIKPVNYDFRIRNKDAHMWSDVVATHIVNSLV